MTNPKDWNKPLIQKRLEQEIVELKLKLAAQSNESLKKLLAEYIADAGRDAKILGYYREHITAQIITDLKGPTKEIIAQDIADIVAGVTSEDDCLVIEMWGKVNV